VKESSTHIIRNRDEAEAFLDERIGRGVQPGLERITGLLEFMGDPQTTYPSIHVAGTNGKTTVSRMLQQILGSHGLATGGFTSPHLERIEERFSIHGVDLDSRDFADAVQDISWFVTGYEETSGHLVTYFEVTAALAFSIFATAAVDVAVVEVGLGGRLDATNALDGTVSVITGIDLDHMEFLGTSITEIAREKVDIVPANGILVTGILPDEATDVVAALVAERSVNWIRHGRDFEVMVADAGVGGWQASIRGVFGEYEDLFLPLHGRHQVDNLATAIASAEMFIGHALDVDLLQLAVAATSAPGRLEVVGRRPLVLLDGSHNAQGVRGLADTLSTEFPAIDWQLVLGIKGERSVPDVVGPLAGLIARVFAVNIDDPTSHQATEVAQEAGEALGVPADAYPTVAEAIEAATEAAGPEGGVVVAGSLYLVGEARTGVQGSEDRVQEAHLRFSAEVELGGEDDDGPQPVNLQDE
jgi:dihydrofolate synthase/folylpolyglutamate synthase